MARRLNFTGRHKINQSDVSIHLLNGPDGLTFDADLTLGEYKLPPDATIHVEAYRSVSTQWKRFDFGRVSARIPPKDRSLAEFEHPEGILFRVKVASGGEAAGRLLAEADKVRPLLPDQKEQESTPIIDTVRGKLGAILWKVSFDGPMPVLVINEQIPDWQGLVKQPIFRALVTPEVMRTVLHRALIVERQEIDEDDPTDWRTRWKSFGETLPGVGKVDVPDAAAEEFSEQEDWIQDAVNSFCNRSGFLEKLIAFQDQGE